MESFGIGLFFMSEWVCESLNLQFYLGQFPQLSSRRGSLEVGQSRTPGHWLLWLDCRLGGALVLCRCRLRLSTSWWVFWLSVNFVEREILLQQVD